MQEATASALQVGAVECACVGIHTPHRDSYDSAESLASCRRGMRHVLTCKHGAHTKTVRCIHQGASASSYMSDKNKTQITQTKVKAQQYVAENTKYYQHYNLRFVDGVLRTPDPCPNGKVANDLCRSAFIKFHE